MELVLRPLTEAEEKYTYSQSIRSKYKKIKQSAVSERIQAGHILNVSVRSVYMAKQNVVNVTSNQKATPAAENEFIYGGYHFTPYGLFSVKEENDFNYLTRKLRTDTELGFFTYDNIAGRTRKYRYNYKAFYAAAGNSTFDIFKCSENGKLYVPGAFELFGYTESI